MKQWQTAARTFAKATGTRATGFGRYLWVNAPSAVPAIAAVMVLVAARYVAILPGGCGLEPGTRAKNWVMCAGREENLPLFDEYQKILESPLISDSSPVFSADQLWQLKKNLLSNDPNTITAIRNRFLSNTPPTIISPSSLPQSNLHRDERSAPLPSAPTVIMQAQPAASSSAPGSQPPPSTHLTFNEIASAKATIESALALAGDLQTRRAAAVAIAIKEGTARRVWTSAFGVMILVAVSAALISLWLIGASIRQHTRILRQDQSPITYLAYFLVLSLPTFLVLYIGMLLVWSRLFVHPIPESWTIWHMLTSGTLATPMDILPSDGITAWLAHFEPLVRDRLFVGVSSVAISLVLLTMLITSTLYQGPLDPQYRKNPENLLNDYPSADQLDSDSSIRFRRHLGRSFERIRVAVYFGAALCAATVVERAAFYTWPLSLIPTERTEVSGAISAFGQQFSFEIGVYFSLFLAALYFPAITILRRRGREFFRRRKPTATLDEQENWLVGERLAFRVSSNYTEWIAMLAPTGFASASHLITAIAG